MPPEEPISATWTVSPADRRLPKGSSPAADSSRPRPSPGTHRNVTLLTHGLGARCARRARSAKIRASALDQCHEEVVHVVAGLHLRELRGKLVQWWPRRGRIRVLVLPSWILEGETGAFPSHLGGPTRVARGCVPGHRVWARLRRLRVACSSAWCRCSCPCPSVRCNSTPAANSPAATQVSQPGARSPIASAHHPDERRGGERRAGPRRADPPLGELVQPNAQAVTGGPAHQQPEHLPHARERLLPPDREERGERRAPQRLHPHHPGRLKLGEWSGQHVVHRPARHRPEHGQRPHSPTVPPLTARWTVVQDVDGAHLRSVRAARATEVGENEKDTMGEGWRRC